jgi:hypothetical protein
VTDPTEALTEAAGASPGGATSAPEAVAWLNTHPETSIRPRTLAQRLADEPPWTGPDEDGDEE